MDNSGGHVMNLANSIIGVSILAMPYCFKQCGVLLSVLILLISSIISRLACHYLLKSAIIARRKTFEFLAFHIFGPLGKFLIEIGMIGFQLGTCVVFFVVMGDLAPEIISEMSGVKIGNALRNSTLVALAVFCILPLGLLKNVDSFNSISVATISFYCGLALKVVVEALPHVFTGDWVNEVVLWRPAGILQCLPIFSMALFCQTQIFEIYQAVPNASLDKMNGVIRVAVNICTWVYIFVGTFGYIAFFQKSFTGNILLSFRPSLISDAIKMGFVLSLAFSFPLVIFPCRASLYSLLYKGASYTSIHEGISTNYIPETKFKILTVAIVFISLTIGILIPNIELVLGLVGSTIGVMICVIFPVTCFICIMPKNTNERILAQIMLFVGIIVMVLGTYANLYAYEEAKLNIPIETIVMKKVLQPEVQTVKQSEKMLVLDMPISPKTIIDDGNKIKEVEKLVIKEELEEKPKGVVQEVQLETKEKQEPVVEPLLPKEEKKILVDDKQEPVVEPVQPKEEEEKKEHQDDHQNEIHDAISEIKEEKKVEEVDQEAIKKEDVEIIEEQNENKEDHNKILIDTIQKQNEVQKEIVEQQKKLIEVIQKQQEQHESVNIDKVNEEKVKAVKEIEDIARKAIESISGQDAKKVTLEVEVKDKNVNNTVTAAQDKVNLSKIKNNQDMINLVPIPIALAKANNISIGDGGNEENLKTIRRDILSESETKKQRNKREISKTTERLNQLNQAVKEVCDENKKTSTEKPLIKMLCKLSDSDLVQLDSAVLKKLEPDNVKTAKTATL